MPRTWAPLALLLAAAFTFALSRGSISPTLPLYLSSLGLSTFEVGVSFASWGMGTLLFEPIIGFLSDKGKRKLMLFVLFGGICVIYPGFTTTKSLLFLCVLQFLYGGFFAGAAVLFRYSIPLVARPLKRSTAFGILGSVFSGAGVVGAVFGGLLTTNIGFGWSFYVAAILTMLAIIPLAAARLDMATAKTKDFEEAGAAVAHQGLAEPILLASTATAAFIVYTVYLSMIPIVLTQIPFNANPTLIGTVIALFNGGVLLFYPLIGELGSGKTRMWIVLGLGVGAFSFAILMVARTLWMVYLSTLLAGASFSTIGTLSLTQFTLLAPKSRTGTAIGIYGAAEDIGIVVAPIIFSGLWFEFGLEIAFAAVAAIQLVILFAYGSYILSHRSPIARVLRPEIQDSRV